MADKLGVEKTHFTLDVLGRYSCNTDIEATEAMNRALKAGEPGLLRIKGCLVTLDKKPRPELAFGQEVKARLLRDLAQRLPSRSAGLARRCT
jgi:2'-5' RNA ligase